MKKRYPLMMMVAIALLVWWYGFRTPPHDPHYDAAACVARDVLGTPTSKQDFADKIRTVITNENNSYTFKKIRYDDALGQSSITRYEALSDAAKATAAKDVDSCIHVMASGQ